MSNRNKKVESSQNGSAIGRSVRVANCSGFFGDRMSALQEMVRGGDIDYITGDYLAEVTMLVLAKLRLRDPEAGYAASFLPQLRPVLKDIDDRGIKVVVNAGGLNPRALAEKTQALCEATGVDLKVAYIEGDDISGRLTELQEGGHLLNHLVTGQPLKLWGHEPLTANAYLGGWGITQALSRGADIVICPRVTDASLVVGIAAHWHGWERDNYDELAGAVVAGHVIECGTQATGGNYSGFNRLDADLLNLGFPLAEIANDGSSIITKHSNTGGAVTVGTVCAQLLYEIQGLDYLNPDVTVEMDSIEISQADKDRVLISPVKGCPPPPTTKVSITALGDHSNQATFILTGLDLDAKAELLETALRQKLEQKEGVKRLHFERIFTRNSEPETQLDCTSFVRVVVSGTEDAVGRSFFQAMVDIALANYPGLTMMSGAGRRAQSNGVYWPGLINQSELDHRVFLPENEEVNISAPSETREPRDRVSDAVASSKDWGSTKPTPLGHIIDARSGDKGGNANVGIWTEDTKAYDWLAEWLTPDRLQQILPEARSLTVERFLLPRLQAMNFVITDLLEGGATETLRLDAQAKALGEYLRAKVVDMPICLELQK